jgi:glyoxylase-like metal-dependent hydrolase (beta-lactamase superfamily II)
VIPPPISIGAIDVHLLRDGTDRVPPEMILVGASPEEIAAAVRGHADADGQLPVAYNGLLIRSAGRLVLVDAGQGRLAESESTGGRLVDELHSLGIEPTAIDDVVVSHCHPDHIGGLTRPDADGRQVPLFGAARHLVWDDEWTWWTSEGALGSMPSFLADPARAALPPLDSAGLIEVATAEREVAPGVRIVPAPGHTPGHVVVAIESAGETAAYVGDAIFHIVNVLAPDWGCVFDIDSAAAVATRRRILEGAARDGSLVLAAHLAMPGRVEAVSGGYRLVPN